VRKYFLPEYLRPKLRNCPRGCTQRRTESYWLAETKTFDGRKCHNCGFELDVNVERPSYHKYTTDIDNAGISLKD